MLFKTATDTEKLFSKVSEYDIFNFYCKGVKNPEINPLREDKNINSFKIFLNEKKQIRFKDFGQGHYGDAIELVKLIYGCSYNEALYLIDKDMSLGVFDVNINPTRKFLKDKKKILNQKQKNKIQITTLKTKWNKEYFDFWNQFGISLKTLKKFDVNPIKMYWKGYNTKYLHKPSNICFEYILGSRVKIYNPFPSKDEIKFDGNCNSNTIQGWKQLSPLNKNLIITSSYKEVMCLYELGYQAIAPNSESVEINPKFINYFKKYFNLFILYDFDKTGQKYSEIHSEKYKCNYFKYFDEENKDLSDFYKNQGKEETIKLLTQTNPYLK